MIISAGENITSADIAYVFNQGKIRVEFPEPPPPPDIDFVKAGFIQYISKQGGVSDAIAPLVNGVCHYTGAAYDMYKDRIHIKPKLIELGFVVNPSQTEFEVWSTYTTPLTLSNIEKTGRKGLVLSGPQPGQILPAYGGHWDYILDVSLDVEMNIDALFEWQFNNGTVKTTLNVLGTRVALWPYPPIYPVTEEWQWFTAVIETRASEQRLSNADKPLQHIEYRYNLPTLAAAEQNARYESQGTNMHAVPIWADATPPVTVKADDLVIYTDVSSRSFSDGGMAVLYKNERDYEVAFIDKVNVDNLLLKRPLMYDYKNVIVLPAITARAPDGVKSVRRGARTEHQISWVNSQPLLIEPPSSRNNTDFDTEYLGKPVIVQRGKSGGVSDDMAFTWREKTTSSGHHIIDIDRDYGRHATNVELIAEGRKQAWQLKQFIYQFKGRLNACWWVSYHRQIRIAALCNRKRIVIKRVGLVEFGGRHLYLNWHDGVQMVYAKSLGYDNDGNEVIDLGGDDDREVTPSDLLGGHIMRLMRPADDKVKITHQPRQLLSVSMPMIEVPDGSH
ncbi:hypothetical protein [Photobacterium sanguinicancri]|uniref:Phage tail protein n=1 Tax=Photobacterium sanguinicancri TaxID=875932 RepID=A0AAW7Y7T4_9GAMM|nr:hypothetical protein [Photobacterium sanguinicancri]MDO6542824.1 hypothetical protein [Photobacterium sanguinicancri]